MGGQLLKIGDCGVTRCQRLGRVVLFVSILLLVVNAPSHSQEQKKGLFGNFTPYIGVAEIYDSNIFLTQRNAKDDFITVVSGGLMFSTQEKNYGIDLGLPMGYVFYTKNRDESFYYVGPGGVNTWYNLTQNLTFRARDYIVRSDAAREGVYSANALPDQFLLSTVRGQKAIYIRNVVEPSLEYRFGKEDFFNVLYRNNIYHNDNHFFEDSMENTVNPRLTYWFDIRNGISFDYGLTFGHFDHSSDFVSNGIRSRYTYRFDPRTSAYVEYYYQNVNFQSGGGDYDVHNPSVGIEYKFSPTLIGTAQVGYFWQLQDQGGETRGPSFFVSLAKNTPRTSYTVAFQGGYTEDYFTSQNLGFAKYYRAYATVNHHLTEKMTVGVTGSVERALFSSDQKDWIWGIWGDVSYRLLRWLAAGLEVSYRKDHSNIEFLSYGDYRAIVSLTLTPF